MPTAAMPGQEDGQENVYCECCGTFEEDISVGNGVKWVQCACKQWIHIVRQLLMKMGDKECVPIISFKLVCMLYILIV